MEREQERERGRGEERAVSVTRKTPTVVSLGDLRADVMVE